MKNITVALLAFTLAYAGYYLYAQNSDLSADSSGVSYTDDMVASAQVFIERRAVLDAVKLDTNIFSDPVFVSYKSFSNPISNGSVGRTNPFGRIVPGQGGSSF